MGLKFWGLHWLQGLIRLTSQPHGDLKPELKPSLIPIGFWRDGVSKGHKNPNTVRPYS